MPQTSGVQNAIHELQQELKRIQDAITMLKRIHSQRAAMASGGGRPRKRLSAKARRRISEAAKKRWAALRSGKAKS